MQPAHDLAHLAPFEPLRQQLLAAAQAFAGAALPPGGPLEALVADVGRAVAEPLEVFPVCHHSPASALHLVRRLRAAPPRVLFLEMGEDLRPLADRLADCKPPVAFQAFAYRLRGLPSAWAPLSAVVPLTEFSAEFQAIAFGLSHPETRLVFVDRSVDVLFQWVREDGGQPGRDPGEDPEEDGNGEGLAPGSGPARGVRVGDVEPTA